MCKVSDSPDQSPPCTAPHPLHSSTTTVECLENYSQWLPGLLSHRPQPRAKPPFPLKPPGAEGPHSNVLRWRTRGPGEGLRRHTRASPPHKSPGPARGNLAAGAGLRGPASPPHPGLCQSGCRKAQVAAEPALLHTPARTVHSTDFPFPLSTGNDAFRLRQREVGGTWVGGDSV